MERIAWGAKVSATFLDRCKWIVEDLQIGVSTSDGMSKLLSCIAWESGRTFSASVTNKAGSGATGLIQFMPATAKALGTTTAALAKMKAEDQLNYVWKYFAPYKGKLKSLSDLYMAILWPKAVGKPETFVLWDKGAMPTTYRQNAGLDINKDGGIIKAEASAKLNAMLAEGMTDKNSVPYGDGAERRFPVVDLPEPLADEPEPVPVPAVETVAVPVLSETAAANVTELAKELPRKTVQDVLAQAPAGVVEHVTEAVKIRAKEKSTWIGAAIAVGSVVADPTVQAALKPAWQAVQHGSFGGILSALIGLGLVIAKSKSSPRTDAVLAAKRLTGPG